MTWVSHDACNTCGICCLELLEVWNNIAIHCNSVVDLRDDLSDPLFGKLLFMSTLINVSQTQLISTRRCKGLSKRVMVLTSLFLLKNLEQEASIPNLLDFPRQFVSSCFP